MGGLHEFFTPCVLSSTHGASGKDHFLICSSGHKSFCEGHSMATQTAVGDLELSLLRTFLAVVQHGSLGKTAAAIEMTQPAVSQQMLRLERIVGQKLFARGRNGITLTRHGELLISYANRAVDLNEEALVLLRAQKPSERVGLGITTDVAMVGLGPALKRFQSLHPDLELKVVVSALPRLEALLRGGQLDLVIADPNLLSGTPAIKWLVALEWAASKYLPLDQSRPLPLVLFEAPCAWQQEMLGSLRSAGWDWRVTFESASMDAILTAVQSGLGIAALPTAAIGNFKLAGMQGTGLPPAPKIQFGMFRSGASQGGAHTVLEDVLASIFTTTSGASSECTNP
jgi:DNA-binding transcriptional LysR family regulator